jgi:hypothetical protein
VGNDDMRYIVILIDFPENAKSSSKNFEVITALPFVFNQDGEQGTDKSYFFDTYKTTNPAKWVGGERGNFHFGKDIGMTIFCVY